MSAGTSADWMTDFTQSTSNFIRPALENRAQHSEYAEVPYTDKGQVTEQIKVTAANSQALTETSDTVY